MFTDGTVTSVKTTATGPAPIEQTRERLRRGPNDVGSPRVSVGSLALVAYLPLLFTRVGKIALDTNDGVYLDTARTLRLAGGRWDPGLMFGSVIDRTDGYAFPMAPWFWLTRSLHIPMWVSQRLWLGSILFLAGLGVLVLLKTMRWDGPGSVPAALAYMLSPYAMQYLGTRSVVLLAWAGLPWLIHFAARSVEAPGWADPARFAICVALATGGNMAASLYMLVGPVLWFVFVGLITREVPAAVLLRTMARVATITGGVCAWLVVGWTYAPRVELAQALAHDPRNAVNRVTTASEVIRGVADWRSYVAASNTFASSVYQRWPAMIALTTAVAAIGLSGLALTRFHNRLYFIGLLVAGMTLSVGAAPVDHREPAGRLLSWLGSTSLGSVFVPSTRAIPLHLLALALGFGAAVRAVIRNRPAAWWSSHVIAGVMVGACVPALFLGRAIDSPLLLAEGVPSYWRQAAAAVNGLGRDLNVLELPGQDTPAYIWGTTNRPISASLLRDPVGLRSDPAVGQRPTRDLLAAIDDQLRNHTLQPKAVAPLAHMMAVGAIVVRTDDVDSEAASEALRVMEAAAQLRTGVVKLDTYGDQRVGAHSVTVFRVEQVGGRLRVYSPTDLAVVAADGRGLVDLANAGLLPEAALMVSAGALDNPRELGSAIVASAPVIITDGNRRERRAAAGDDASVGATETIDGSTWGGPVGERLTPRPGEAVDSSTHVELSAGAKVFSSAYGSAHRFEPADRPTLAFDGDSTSGWRVGRGRSPVGERIVLQLPAALTTDAIVLHQEAGSRAGRSVTGVHLEFDGWRSQNVQLRDPRVDQSVVDGERIALSTTTFRTLAIEITSVADGDLAAGAGFSEIEIPGLAPLDETVVLPDDLLRFGDGLATHPITVSMSRWRDEAHGNDPERTIDRSFSLPTITSFGLVGEAHAVAGVTTIDSACRTDLITIDGRPTPVRIDADPTTGIVGVTGCEPVIGGPGPVAVRTVRLGSGAGREMVIDRLTLSSVTAEPSPSPANPPPAPADPEITIDGSTGLTIELPKASTGVWMYRAAGASDAWTATVDGKDLDRSFLANGFGLAWPLDVGDGDRHVVEVRIPAQRRVSIAVIASTIAGLIAVALAFRRRVTAPDLEPMTGVIRRPRRVPVPVVALVAIVVLGVAGGAIAALTAGAVAMGIEYRRAVGRPIGWLAAIVLVAVGVAKTAWQLTTSPPINLAWPALTPVLDVLTWTAVAAIVAVGVGTASNRERIRRPPV